MKKKFYLDKNDFAKCSQSAYFLIYNSDHWWKTYIFLRYCVQQNGINISYRNFDVSLPKLYQFVLESQWILVPRRNIPRNIQHDGGEDHCYPGQSVIVDLSHPSMIKCGK